MRSRTIIMLGAALVVIAAALNFREGRSGNAVVGDRDHIRLSQSSETEAVRDVSFDDMNAGERTRAARPSSGQAAEAEVKATNPLAGLLEGNGVLTMAPEAIAGWLAVNKTNAASLLAAAQMGGNSSLFLTALTNFPDDPRVLFRVAAPNQLPEARRELLDRLKAVAPENALADYLSARDHMKNGRTDEALQDLLAATGKTRFNDHGEGSFCLIDQLVGYAIERTVISPLDQQTSFPFLNGTVPDHIEQLQAKRAAAKRSVEVFNQWWATASQLLSLTIAATRRGPGS